MVSRKRAIPKSAQSCLVCIETMAFGYPPFQKIPISVDYWNPSQFSCFPPRMFHSTFQVYRIQTAMTTDSEIPTCYFNATFLFLLSELHTVLP